MFLIVEGLHDSGKTTLVNDILSFCSCKSGLEQSIQQFQLYSGKRLFPELSNATATNVSDFALGTNCAVAWFAKHYSTLGNVIFDRAHISEYAYSIAKRGQVAKFAQDRFHMIDSQLALCNVKLIYLYCNYEVIISRAKIKNAVYDKKDFDYLTQLFTEMCNETKIPMIKLDTGSFTKDHTFAKAVEFIGGI